MMENFSIWICGLTGLEGAILVASFFQHVLQLSEDERRSTDSLAGMWIYPC